MGNDYSFCHKGTKKNNFILRCIYAHAIWSKDGNFFNMEGLRSIIISYYGSCIAMIACGLYFLREIHLFSGIKVKYSVSLLFGLTIPMLLSSAIDVINAQIDQYI